MTLYANFLKKKNQERLIGKKRAT